jgi:hypothetical protein
MEQEHFEPGFQEIYKDYIRKEKEESDRIYREIAPELTLRSGRTGRRWFPAAAAVLLILITGTWALTSDHSPLKSRHKYTKAEVRKSLEKTIHALSACSKTVREEFSRIEDLTAMTSAIKPVKKNTAGGIPKSDSNTIKN